MYSDQILHYQTGVLLTAIILTMKLYFVRHGQTKSNVDMAYGKSINDLDDPLDETGISQANELAEKLKDTKFDVLVSSPLKRAHQTAKIINKKHNLPIKINEDWVERRAGEYIDPYKWHQLFDLDKDLPVGDGESASEFFARGYKAIEDLKKKHGDKSVLVVSHGGMQHVLYAYTNKLPLKGNLRISPMNNCEYRIYEL